MSHLQVKKIHVPDSARRPAALHFTNNNSLQTAILPRTFLSCVAHADILRPLAVSSS